jgi:predicted nucleotidyltransferase
MNEKAIKNKANQTLDLASLSVLLVRIQETYNPLQIWLFGSRARGDAKPDSDWDILVVVPDDTPEEKLEPQVARQVRRGSGVAADINPFRLREFQEDFRVANTLPNEIAYDGVLLYER